MSAAFSPLPPIHYRRWIGNESLRFRAVWAGFFTVIHRMPHRTAQPQYLDSFSNIKWWIQYWILQGTRDLCQRDGVIFIPKDYLPSASRLARRAYASDQTPRSRRRPPDVVPLTLSSDLTQLRSGPPSRFEGSFRSANFVQVLRRWPTPADGGDGGCWPQGVFVICDADWQRLWRRFASSFVCLLVSPRRELERPSCPNSSFDRTKRCCVRRTTSPDVGPCM